MLGGVMTTLSSMTNVTHRHTSESSSKENVCAKGAYLIILCVEGLFYITNILVLFFLSLHIFAVSQKINLLNQLTRQSSTGSNNGGMNNQRTLDLIREDLGHLVETEGTYWDTRHPHIFVVMGASVSHEKLFLI